MIEEISGVLVSKLPHRVVVEWQGLSLEIFIPFSTFKTLEDVGSKVKLCCHLHWREEGPQLFGFAGESERAFFRLLTKVNKIGPKLAINIMSAAPLEKIVEMILTESIHGLTALKGVGNKLASRLVVELKEPIAKLGIGTAQIRTSSEAGHREFPFENEVRESLENLGYTNREIEKALREIAPSIKPDAEIQEVIETILRSFAG